jgi:hypothetical protein
MAPAFREALMAHDEFKKEFEEAVSHLSDTTKSYIRAQKELLERYIGRMNAVNYNIPLVYELQKLLAKEAKALHDEYLEERGKQGLPPEVGCVKR